MHSERFDSISGQLFETGISHKNFDLKIVLRNFVNIDSDAKKH